MKARIFNIMQYKRHPKTGETLLMQISDKRSPFLASAV